MSTVHFHNALDVASNTTSFITDIIGKSAIPGLSIASVIIKRGIDTYDSNQFIKNEGIKNLVVFKHLCDNTELLVSRQKQSDELAYVYSKYKELRVSLDDILSLLDNSIYSNILHKEYENYPGDDKISGDDPVKVLKLELLPDIIRFVQKELNDKSFNTFVDIHLKSFDDEKMHDIWVQTWKNSGFKQLNKIYSEFLDSKITENKSILNGKLSAARQDKLDSLRKNMEQWQLYMDTLYTFTNIEDIYLFMINYKNFKDSPKRPFDVVKFAKKYMVDPVKVQYSITNILTQLDVYIDSIIILIRKNQIGGRRPPTTSLRSKKSKKVKVRRPTKGKKPSK